MSIYAYMRVSTDLQDHALQRDAIEARYQQIAGWYTDKGTGRKTQPSLNRLLKHVKRGDKIVVYALDRLGRSVANVTSIMRQCDEWGVSVVIIKQQIDTSTSAGRLMLHLLASIAEFEGEMIRERVSAGVRAAMKRGVKFGKKPLYETSREHKKALDEAVRLKKKGISYREIVKRMQNKYALPTLSYGAIRKHCVGVAEKHGIQLLDCKSGRRMD